MAEWVFAKWGDVGLGWSDLTEAWWGVCPALAVRTKVSQRWCPGAGDSVRFSFWTVVIRCLHSGNPSSPALKICARLCTCVVSGPKMSFAVSPARGPWCLIQGGSQVGLPSKPPELEGGVRGHTCQEAPREEMSPRAPLPLPPHPVPPRLSLHPSPCVWRLAFFPPHLLMARISLALLPAKLCLCHPKKPCPHPLRSLPPPRLPLGPPGSRGQEPSQTTPQFQGPRGCRVAVNTH